jgi:hypothetical protein
LPLQQSRIAIRLSTVVVSDSVAGGAQFCATLSMLDTIYSKNPNSCNGTKVLAVLLTGMVKSTARIRSEVEPEEQSQEDQDDPMKH